MLTTNLCKQNLIVCFLASMMVISSSTSLIAQKTKQFSPSDNNIHLIGRHYTLNKKVSFANSGTSIEFTLTGQYLNVIFEDMGLGGEQHTNYIGIEVNGEIDSVLQIKNGKHNYNLSSLLKKDTNSIKLIKRTEASVGEISFYGLVTKPTQFLTTHTIQQRKILWIGDSFMCGYGNELSIPPPPDGNPTTGFKSKNENSYMTWSSISSRKTNSQAHQICYSGRGLYRNADGSTSTTIPFLFDFVNTNSETSRTWNHHLFSPEVTIIALGTNDFGPEMNDHTDLCDSIKYIEKYKTLISRIYTVHPNTTIIVVTGNGLTDFWPSGLKRLTRARNFNLSVVNSFKGKNIHHFELSTQTPPYGEDWHPTIATHKKMSKEFTPFLMKVMNWN